MRPASLRRFPLSAAHREAAQAWIEFGERTPSKPRYASSVVLLKDSSSGLQTFMTYRPGGSPLGIVAFPGGTIEAADDDVTNWVGPSPVDWAKRLGMEDIGLAKRLTRQLWWRVSPGRSGCVHVNQLPHRIRRSPCCLSGMDWPSGQTC